MTSTENDPIKAALAFYVTDNCTGCTACVARCPTRAIAGRRGRLHVVDPRLCVDCGACGVVCPDEAIFDSHGNPCELLDAMRRPSAHVDVQSCAGCQCCVWGCPFEALEMRDSPGGGEFARVAVVREQRCVGCGLCELDCPHGAIRVWRGDDPRVVAVARRNDEFLGEVGAERFGGPPGLDGSDAIASGGA